MTQKSENSSSVSRIVRNTFYLYFKMFVTLLIALYSSRVFLQVLGVSDFGLYNLVAGTILTLGFFKDILSEATMRYICFYKGERDDRSQTSVFNISLALHLVISLLIAIALVVAAIFLFDGFLNIPAGRVDVAKTVYYLMICSFVLEVMSVPYDSVLNANENMLYYSAIGITEAFLRLALALYIPFAQSDKLVFFAVATVSISVFSLVVKRIYCHRKYDECRIDFHSWNQQIMKDMVSYAGWNLFTSTTWIIGNNSMNIIINKFFGTVVNAAQGVAAHVNGVLSNFSSNLTKSINPVLSKSMGESDTAKMMRFAFSGTKVSFLVFCLFCSPIILEAPYILELWLKDVPEWTVIFCQLLLVRTLTNQMVILFARCIYASDRIRDYCLLKGVLNLLPIILLWIVYDKGFPPYYAYVVYFLVYELMGGALVIFYNKRMYHLKFRHYIQQIVLPCSFLFLTQMLCGLYVNSLLEQGVIRFVVNGVLVTAILLSFAWFFIFNQSEKEIILKWKRK